MQIGEELLRSEKTVVPSLFWTTWPWQWRHTDLLKWQ